MKFNISKWQKFWAYDFGWHKWFAWCPVIVEDKLVWLETVERIYQCFYDSHWYEYRLIKKEKK